MNGLTVLGTVALSGGVATYTTPKLPPGADTITANYLGAADYASSSASLTQIVQ
jgi:Bacterial Ig-like domain (group 3)